mmetsp:Transcript_33698/g.73939  ORF Transcript_33698/g.73939 Transcript_33698/m.73939 type:complete len:216 (+) Transcript_33698:902-1549(+)
MPQRAPQMQQARLLLAAPSTPRASACAAQRRRCPWRRLSAVQQPRGQAAALRRPSPPSMPRAACDAAPCHPQRLRCSLAVDLLPSSGCGPCSDCHHSPSFGFDLFDARGFALGRGCPRACDHHRLCHLSHGVTVDLGFCYDMIRGLCYGLCCGLSDLHCALHGDLLNAHGFDPAPGLDRDPGSYHGHLCLDLYACCDLSRVHDCGFGCEIASGAA